MKTHDDLKTADEIHRAADIRSLCTLSGIEANTPVNLDNRALEMALAHDRQLLNRQMESIERSQQRLLGMRSKLKAKKRWNQRIQEQRKQIMKQRRTKGQAQPQAAKQPVAAGPAKGFVLTY